MAAVQRETERDGGEIRFLKSVSWKCIFNVIHLNRAVSLDVKCMLIPDTETLRELCVAFPFYFLAFSSLHPEICCLRASGGTT